MQVLTINGYGKVRVKKM